MQAIGKYGRRSNVLLRMVKAATMYGPQFATDAPGRIIRIPGTLQMIVEPDEIQRRTNPRDAGNKVQPTHEEANPVEKICFQSISSADERCRGIPR